MENNITSRIHRALNNVTTRPAGYALLGRGDSSGAIVADTTQRLLYYFTVNQPPATAPLVEGISISPYIGLHPELEGMRVRLGYPPERPNVLHIVGFDQGEGLSSVKGITPQEQLQAAQKYVDAGSLVNFRLAPNSPVDSELYINPGWYIDSTGAPAFWGGGSTGDITTLLQTTIAALTSGNHLMAAVYIDTITREPGIITNSEEEGGQADKQLFDTTTLEEMTWPDGCVPCGAVHLYYGQSLCIEGDIYRAADNRVVFNATGLGGDAVITIAGNSGTPFDATDGDTVTFEGTGGIDVVTDDVTKTVIIDGSGVAPGINQLTGDVTAGPGSGSQAATLATVNGNVGSFTNASVTVNGKGLITSASSGTAPVTSVGASSPIASSGGTTPTISHSTSGVTAASYTYASITVNATGHVTAASNGTAPKNITVNWQSFSSNGTWTKPTGAFKVEVTCIGGGGGGGSGRRGAAATNIGGGGGGGAGYVLKMDYAATQLTSSVSVTIGTGGAGGASIGVNNTNGSAGAMGSATIFGAYLYASGGNGGAAGINVVTNAGGTGATTVNRNWQFYGSNGGASGAPAAVGATPAAWGPGGGGGGGSIASDGTPGNGGGGASAQVQAFGIAGAGTGGTAGTGVSPTGGNGTAGVIDGTSAEIFGAGGGGGVAAGANGGDGGLSGGGGGGGGASSNGTVSGEGGNGGDGVIIVVSYCWA